MILYAILDPRPDPYPDPTARFDQPSEKGEFPASRVYVLEPQSDGDVIVCGYAADGEFSGDTWYATPQDAMDSLRSDHADALSDWRETGTDDLEEAAKIALMAAARKFRIGSLEGKLGTGPDFFEPLSERELQLWEGDEENRRS